MARMPGATSECVLAQIGEGRLEQVGTVPEASESHVARVAKNPAAATPARLLARATAVVVVDREGAHPFPADGSADCTGTTLRCEHAAQFLDGEAESCGTSFGGVAPLALGAGPTAGRPEVLKREELLAATAQVPTSLVSPPAWGTVGPDRTQAVRLTVLLPMRCAESKRPRLPFAQPRLTGVHSGRPARSARSVVAASQRRVRIGSLPDSLIVGIAVAPCPDRPVTMTAFPPRRTLFPHARRHYPVER